MNKENDKEYDIYFLSDVSYEALRATTALLTRVDSNTPKSKASKDQLLIRWQNLRLSLDDSKKLVKLYCDKKDGTIFIGGKDMPIGFLSEEDGRKYIPYLRKGWLESEKGSYDLYEGCVIGINEKSQDPSQRIQVAIRIRKPNE